MRIGVECDLHIAVTEPLGHDLGVNPLLKEYGCMSMPEFMQFDVRHAGGLDERYPYPRAEVAWMNRLASASCEHEVLVIVEGT